MPIHQEYRLFVSNDAYTLVADSDKPETLSISRAANSIHIQPDYLIVITKRTKVAHVLSTPIYSAADFAVFPIERTSSSELLRQPEEAYLLGLVKSHLYSAPFYFSYGGYNVSTKLQAQEPGEKNLWETADDRFFWNRHLQRRLIDATTGSAEIDFKPATINGRRFLFGLISRRNRFRAGTRYFSRGIDRDGNVSNFNETEQILLLDTQNGEAGERAHVRGDLRFSYVQTRGSVPVYWAEINNLRYKPDLKIMDLSSTAESLSRHFESQISIYGDQYLVNLVNQKGYEKPVKEAYERALEAMNNPRVHYTYFDFHHECRGLRFDRVSVLIDGLDEELKEQGYFYHDTTASSHPQRKQTSVVRTNCMDCLDRTNVVQSALGKWVLNNQLRQAGVLSVKESVDEHPAFLALFRNGGKEARQEERTQGTDEKSRHVPVWADNADVVSRAYSGTGALKTDYTRTGKRSAEGALQDGINSIIRYVKNNFLDGPRQDAYDLVTGTWQPRRGEDLGWGKEGKGIAVRAAPWVLLGALAILFLSVLVPDTLADYLAPTPKLSLLAVVLAALSTHSILTNGIDYVSQPRLMRSALDEVLGYEGKGYESGRRGRPVRKAKMVSVEQAAKQRQMKKERKESVLPMLSTPQQGATKMD
ncbi:SPOSA6832_03410 [Sporobolomyces salmonicolor]|uniref:SPOSA6832_03410-mRNA-1:cds n=1 Tax=Sporidiobolus salmonicolor TaxID=5005 RepID=A0A0D6EP23_SPOSA|nr:SPOSA6832_03410 [Sporobolomyces salmonicolor]